MAKLTTKDRKRIARALYTSPPPASQTREGKAKIRKYRTALGTFVDYFAKVEMAMHFALRWHTKTEDFVARAVFSGVRADATTGHLPTG